MPRERRQIHVTVQSDNPLLWVSAVRQALRRTGAGEEEIDRFTEVALGAGRPERMRQVCAAWARIDFHPQSPSCPAPGRC